MGQIMSGDDFSKDPAHKNNSQFEEIETIIENKDPNEERGSISLGLLIFLFGLAGGFLVAFSALDILEESYQLVLGLLIVVLITISMIGFILFTWRKPLMKHVFGMVETRLESFAGPLSEVAKGAANRDPQTATEAARLLIHRALARYAWLSTRRWIIASLTGLIAAMAALAGTTLLFRQNQLIEVQSQLLSEQNVRISEQTELLKQDVELAEAARNAELAVEITQIGSLLGEAVKNKLALVQNATPGQENRITFPILDPIKDLDPSLLIRTATASRSVKPYRFLEASLRDEAAHDEAASLHYAMKRREADLTQLYQRMKVKNHWNDDKGAGLTDRPASPERGQILETLFLAGVRSFESFSSLGLDLSFAYATNITLFDSSLQTANMAFADLSRGYFTRVDFRGASLGNARFRNTRIENSQFSTIMERDLNPPLTKKSDDILSTNMPGTDFSHAFILDSNFSQGNMSVAQFDRAALIRCDFTNAVVPVATFRGAVIFEGKWDGAILTHTDFDGAFVFDESFLDKLAEKSYPGSFKRDHFTQISANLEQVHDVKAIFSQYTTDELASLIGNRKVWQIKRIKPYEAPLKETENEGTSKKK